MSWSSWTISQKYPTAKPYQPFHYGLSYACKHKSLKQNIVSQSIHLLPSLLCIEVLLIFLLFPSLSSHLCCCCFLLVPQNWGPQKSGTSVLSSLTATIIIIIILAFVFAILSSYLFLFRFFSFSLAYDYHHYSFS